MPNKTTETLDDHDCPLLKPGFRPNAETLEAMRELREGGGFTCNTVEELMADLNRDD